MGNPSRECRNLETHRRGHSGIDQWHKNMVSIFRSGGLVLAVLVLLLWLSPANGETRDPQREIDRVPILVYHRFGPVASDTMTVTNSSFESQLKYLRDHHYAVIRLRQLLDSYLGKSHPAQSRSVVITVDDGHKTVYTDLLPLLKAYQIPVTLFLYPSALSNASYAMSWDQIRELGKTGLVEFQSHTFWHPNFKNEKKRLKPVEYENFVDMQLGKSKERLEKELHVKVDVLAWPFGIYDEELMIRATKAGYVAALSIDRRHASQSDNAMALPRYLISNADPLSRYGL
jgi:peptidoglycan/xylan/chitin deacetylase (PgdA/CDA1 family)